MNICSKCGYEWESRKPNPKCCPMCKSYKWQKEVEKPSRTFKGINLREHAELSPINDQCFVEQDWGA